MHAYIRIDTHIRICIHTHTYIHTLTHTHTHTQAPLQANTSTCATGYQSTPTQTQHSTDNHTSAAAEKVTCPLHMHTGRHSDGRRRRTNRRNVADLHRLHQSRRLCVPLSYHRSRRS